MFESLDTDNSGFLEFKEFRVALMYLNDANEDIDVSIISSIDEDESGSIDYNEFVLFMSTYFDNSVLLPYLKDIENEAMVEINIFRDMNDDVASEEQAIYSIENSKEEILEEKSYFYDNNSNVPEVIDRKNTRKLGDHASKLLDELHSREMDDLRALEEALGIVAGDEIKETENSNNNVTAVITQNSQNIVPIAIKTNTILIKYM